jgi:hypothetical protein
VLILQGVHMQTAATIIGLVLLVLLVAWVAVVARRRSADPTATATSRTPMRSHDVKRVDNTGA